MEISASQFLECGDRIRESLLDLLFGGLDNEISDNTYGYAGVASAFDRAMIAALKLSSRAEVPKLAASIAPIANSKPGPKAGSAAARKRAQRAAETRAVNKARQQVEKDAEAARNASVKAPQGNSSTLAAQANTAKPIGIPGTSSTQFAGDGGDKGGA
jgi:hypothetical protein